MHVSMMAMPHVAADSPLPRERAANSAVVTVHRCAAIALTALSAHMCTAHTAMLHALMQYNSATGRQYNNCASGCW